MYSYSGCGPWHRWIWNKIKLNMWPRTENGAHNINAVKRCLIQLASNGEYSGVQFICFWHIPFALWPSLVYRKDRETNVRFFIIINGKGASEWRAAQHFICIPSLLVYRVFFFLAFSFVRAHNFGSSLKRKISQRSATIRFFGNLYCRVFGAKQRPWCVALIGRLHHLAHHRKEIFIGPMLVRVRACANALGGVNGRRNICE